MLIKECLEITPPSYSIKTGHNLKFQPFISNSVLAMEFEEDSPCDKEVKGGFGGHNKVKPRKSTKNQEILPSKLQKKVTPVRYQKRCRKR